MLENEVPHKEFLLWRARLLCMFWTRSFLNRNGRDAYSSNLEVVSFVWPRGNCFAQTEELIFFRCSKEIYDFLVAPFSEKLQSLNLFFLDFWEPFCLNGCCLLQSRLVCFREFRLLRGLFIQPFLFKTSSTLPVAVDFFERMFFVLVSFWNLSLFSRATVLLDLFSHLWFSWRFLRNLLGPLCFYVF